MRIAITSQGNSLESMLDQHFGHAKYFLIYDTQTGVIEIIPNPYNQADEQAGFLAVNLLASKNVDKIISGEFGLKVKPKLDSLKIQMIVLRNSTMILEEIIDMLNKTYRTEI